VDIKELKLLGEFAHPNIVRFVRIACTVRPPGSNADTDVQIGVSIPENTKETPVMIVSELCTNGDLFDYVRNVPPPKLSKVVRHSLS
jgi:mitogen-activated protein kinase kinase kinase 13